MTTNFPPENLSSLSLYVWEQYEKKTSQLGMDSVTNTQYIDTQVVFSFSWNYYDVYCITVLRISQVHAMCLHVRLRMHNVGQSISNRLVYQIFSVTLTPSLIDSAYIGR